MKKIFKPSNIFFFVLGIVLMGSIGYVYAYAMFSTDSTEVAYIPNGDETQLKSVQDALDELYSLSENSYQIGYEQGWQDKPFNLTIRASTSYGTNCTPEAGLNVSASNSFTNDGTWKTLKITSFTTDTNKTWPISVRNTAVKVTCDSTTLGSSTTIGTTYDISNCTEIKIGVSGKGYGSCQTGSTSTHAGITCVVTAN